MALSYILGYGFAAAAGIMTGILYNSITPALGEVPSYKMLAIIVSVALAIRSVLWSRD